MKDVYLGRDESPTSRHDRLEFERENVWSCGRCRTDRRLLVYITQISVTLTTLIFCMIKIILGDDGDITIWVSILSTIVGNFMPAIASPPKENTNNMETGPL